MLKNLLIAICAICIFTACNKKADTTNLKLNPEDVQYFGEKISSNNVLTFNQLLQKMEGKESMKTKVVGKVESVCKKKGCWVNLVSEDGKEMFVKFKDYGFFLPLDCEGQKVVMEGEAFREVTSVDDLRHLAEDGGATPEEIAKITEPKEELKFMASGVILVSN